MNQGQGPSKDLERKQQKGVDLIGQMGIRTQATRFKDQGCYHWASDADLVKTVARDN
jgi:hypothetical protein